jgi:nucleoside-diphosphate-sugar epimerase
MTNVTIFGGTGYAGSHIAREAVKRGHAVVSYSRKPPGRTDKWGCATSPARYCPTPIGARDDCVHEVGISRTKWSRRRVA